MKWLRNIILITFILILTSLVALWAITYFAQPVAFKHIVKKQLSSLTHQDSAIDGNINWRIFPKPGLHLTKVRIGDVNQIDGDYAASIENLTFHVQLIPLLEGQIVFDKLIIDGFTLRVNIGEAGSAITPETRQKKSVRQKAIPALPTHIALNTLLLTSGQIILAEENEQLVLQNVRLEATLPQKNRSALSSATQSNPQENIQKPIAKWHIKL